MISLSPGLAYFDLQFLGTPHVIATALVHGPGGAALIDPGPSTALDGLRAGLTSAGVAAGEVTAILRTHIHPDHAVAVGTLGKRNPELRVYVHAKGAPHLIDPEKLLASAARLYGTEMERLWGEVLPVPARNVTI